VDVGLCQRMRGCCAGVCICVRACGVLSGYGEVMTCRFVGISVEEMMLASGAVAPCFEGLASMLGHGQGGDRSSRGFGKRTSERTNTVVDDIETCTTECDSCRLVL
jgi:hypothetical protein